MLAGAALSFRQRVFAAGAAEANPLFQLHGGKGRSSHDGDAEPGLDSERRGVEDLAFFAAKQKVGLDARQSSRASLPRLMRLDSSRRQWYPTSIETWELNFAIAEPPQSSPLPRWGRRSYGIRVHPWCSLLV